MLTSQVPFAVHQWYAGLTLYAGLPAEPLLARLCVLSAGKSCNLDIDAHTVAGGVQIRQRWARGQ